MHSNGLFLIRLKVAALPASPTQIVNLLEPVEVRGKKKSIDDLIEREESKLRPTQ